MTRFAIYYAPPEDSPLSRLGSSWLGRAKDQDPPRGALPEHVWRSATSDPRAYGFHATLKPPFRLKPGANEAELFASVHDFAASQNAFTAPGLRVSPLSSFLALTLSQPCWDFEALAADCVREFDRFRMPPSEDELARRRRGRLSAKQLEYIERWGYPYVMDEWKFHMTLTSSLEPPLFESMGDYLKELFSAHCGKPFCVDSICIFKQAGAGELFEIAGRFRLK